MFWKILILALILLLMMLKESMSPWDTQTCFSTWAGIPPIGTPPERKLLLPFRLHHRITDCPSPDARGDIYTTATSNDKRRTMENCNPAVGYKPKCAGFCAWARLPVRWVCQVSFLWKPHADGVSGNSQPRFPCTCVLFIHNYFQTWNHCTLGRKCAGGSSLLDARKCLAFILLSWWSWSHIYNKFSTLYIRILKTMRGENIFFFQTLFRIYIHLVILYVVECLTM